MLLGALNLKQKLARVGLLLATLPVLALLLLSRSSADYVGAIKSHPSPNFNERKHPVSMIVLHYTGIPSCRESLVRLCATTNFSCRVSAHYLVDRDGTIYNLIDESKRAWHAGAGSWTGLDDINSRSVGIEIVNVGLTAAGRRAPFPDKQIDAVVALCKEIIRRHGIRPRNVVGHSDVAPSRKQDPGEAFPWARLAKAGVGIWTDDLAKPKASAEEMLAAIGYDVSVVDHAMVAFQRHWHPEGITDGATNTIGRIAAVYNLIKNPASN